MSSIVKKMYETKALPELQKFLETDNIHALPKIEKVVINVGVGKYLKETNRLEEIRQSLEMITGQRVVTTKARKAIAGFKIREGLEVGMRVTLRGERMWAFLDRFIHVGLPRVRDFQGISRKNIDTYGNLNVGLKEQTVFPEIVPEKVQTLFSFQVTVVTTAKNKTTGEKLFEYIGMPLQAVTLSKV